MMNLHSTRTRHHFHCTHCGRDATLAPVSERIEAPAQSLETLHNPRAGHAARGAALAGLQRVMGNAQVTRELYRQSITSNGAATVNNEERRNSAEAIRQQWPDGILLSFYANYPPTGNEKEDNNNQEFKRRAEAQAPAVNAIGVNNGHLALGVTHPIQTPQEMISIAQSISQILRSQLSAEIVAQTPEVCKIKHLLIYAHGWDGGIRLGSSGAQGRLNRRNVQGFVQGIRGLLTNDVHISLLACSTGSSAAGGEGSFADKLRDTLTDDSSGQGLQDASVSSHFTAGHTTGNPNIRIFGGTVDGTDLNSGGASLFDLIFTEEFIEHQASTHEEKPQQFRRNLIKWYRKYVTYWRRSSDAPYHVDLGFAAMLNPDTVVSIIRNAFNAAQNFEDYSYEPPHNLRPFAVPQTEVSRMIANSDPNQFIQQGTDNTKVIMQRLLDLPQPLVIQRQPELHITDGTTDELRNELERLQDELRLCRVCTSERSSCTPNEIAKYEQLINKLQLRIAERGNSMLTDCPTSLMFDGHTLYMQGEYNQQFSAVSGKPINGNFDYSPERQRQENEGPIPQGVYWLDTSELKSLWYYLGKPAAAWGTHRISIHPFHTTHTFGRGGFFIHGGTSPGSSGCIDLTGDMASFAKIIARYLECKIILRVNYPVMSDFPLPQSNQLPT